jgi:hypothetical protein
MDPDASSPPNDGIIMDPQKILDQEFDYYYSHDNMAHVTITSQPTTL